MRGGRFQYEKVSERFYVFTRFKLVEIHKQNVIRNKNVHTKNPYNKANSEQWYLFYKTY